MATLDKLKKLAQALKSGAVNQYEQGAPYRNAAMQAVQGNFAPASDILNKPQQIDPNEPVNVALGFAPMGLGTIGNAASKLTKYEQNQLTAQKNAVEMLGLPANNTAMDRAKAMGYTTPAYHGTKSDITAFDKAKDQTNAGFWFGEAPTASKFAMASRNGVEGGENVMPVLLKQDNPMTYEAGMQMTIPQISKYAKSSGYDSVNFNGPKSGQVNLVHEPENIRSRFAAFDPAKRNSSDIMGFADPALLGTIAGGGLIGLTAKDRNKK
jgi:hypothetical protein